MAVTTNNYPLYDEETDYTATFIGIITAISGNVLISLALNCQKLAHKRLDRERSSRHTSSENRSRQSLGAPHTALDDDNMFGSGECTHTQRNTEIRDADSDDADDDEQTRVGESSQRQSPDSDVESDYNAPVPFPESGPDTPSPSPRGTTFRDRAHSLLVETQPLLLAPGAVTASKGSMRGGGYGTSIEIGNRSRSTSAETGRGSWRECAKRTRSSPHPHFLSRLFSSAGKSRRADNSDLEATGIPVDVRITGPDSGYASPSGRQSTPKIKFAEPVVHDENETDYLKSKLWWFGFILMVVGEGGNFISYGFAPASVVAPLGTFALIANCFFAPLMLKERFRKRDLLGILLAILGAITVVLSASSSDRRLDPDGLIHAITQRAFLGLTCIYAGGAALLVSLSSQRIGKEHVWVDVGACALFGGFTVLSTKAVSSLLTREWVALFKEWITYPVLAVLIGTGIGQIRYLNRALMKFDSKVVIPAQFVLFNISAIVGSAVLYGDFRSATLHQMVTFLYGCGATFVGVFMLTWGSTGAEHSHGKGRAEVGGVDERMRRGQSAVSGPLSPPRPSPLLRAKTSSITLSPAQRALLVRTLSEADTTDESS